MVTVEEDLRFDDRDETGVLADGRVAGEAVSAVRHGDLGRTGRDGDDGAPLAEARALLVVLSRAFGEAVETLAPRLAVGVGERPEALVNLDTRVHAFLAERVDERGAILARLVQGFFEENRTADVFAHTLGGDEQLAVAAAVFFGVFDPDAFESGTARGVGLVHGEDTLTRLGHVGLRASRIAFPSSSVTAFDRFRRDASRFDRWIDGLSPSPEQPYPISRRRAVAPPRRARPPRPPRPRAFDAKIFSIPTPARIAGFPRASRAHHRVIASSRVASRRVVARTAVSSNSSSYCPARVTHAARLATVVLAVAFATTLTPVNVEAEASIVSIVVGCEECGVARARASSRARRPTARSRAARFYRRA